MAVVKPTEDVSWATSTLSNGQNSTLNKVEPTAAHKTNGWGFPEQPPRNYLNWWKNAVYKYIQYFTQWTDQFGSINKQFAWNEQTTTGLTFGFYGGKLDLGRGSQVVIADGTLNLNAGNGTYYVYVNVATSAVAFSYNAAPVPTDNAPRMYTVTVAGGAITTVVDDRTWATVLQRATTAQVTTGTNDDAYVTPLKLQEKISANVTPSATTSAEGKARIGTQGEVDDPVGTGITVNSPVFVNPRTLKVRLDAIVATIVNATTSVYGKVRLADDTDLANRNTDDVLTATSLARPNLQASTTVAGIQSNADASAVNVGTATNLSVTPHALANSNMVSIGVNQTWQNFTGTRLNGVNYTNTSGRPIMVSLVVVGADTGIILTVSGLNVAHSSTAGNLGNDINNATTIVPNGAVYKATVEGGWDGTLRWYELR